MTQTYPPIISGILKACSKASVRLIRDFSELEKLQISKKGLSDFVTQADVKTEELLVSELGRLKPGCSFLLEETGEMHSNSSEDSTAAAYRWIVDPIDGTVNFMHGNPNFCISIALERTAAASSTKEIVSAVIHCPFLHESYWAEKGKGAYHINYIGQQSRMRVGMRPNFLATLCGISSITQLRSDDIQLILNKLQENHVKMRISGSIALDLAYVACGRLDMAVYSKLKPWDIAAGLLLIREAGGVVRNIVGNTPFDDGASIITSNTDLCDKMIN